MAEFNEKYVFTGRARLRARDVREKLNGRNIDSAIIQTFEMLCDNDKTQRDQIEALADLVNKQTDLILQMQAIMQTVADRVPDIRALASVSNVLNTDANKLMKNTAFDTIKLKTPEET